MTHCEFSEADEVTKVATIQLAISIRQPYVELILQGKKRKEYRERLFQSLWKEYLVL